MQDTAVRPFAPGFDGRPVALTHLATDDSPEGRKLAACCGEPFTNPTQDVGRTILCPACMMGLGRR